MKKLSLAIRTVFILGLGKPSRLALEEGMADSASLGTGWWPFALGSVPHADVQTAYQLVRERFPQIACWPQLPSRSRFENMYAQSSERYPGITFDESSMFVDRRKDLDRDLERLYLAYLEDHLDYGRLSASYAAGLDVFLKDATPAEQPPLAAKGQVTGPVSWGLTVVDQNRRPILYEEVLADAVGKHLRIKASWQEQQLSRISPQTIMMVDEPYMASFGSAFVALSRDQVVGLLEEVFAGLRGLKGIHCCGNTDWSILLSTSLNLLSLDAYDYGATLALYAEDVARFLADGGIIAWGIVPAGIAAETETVETLVTRLHDAIEEMVKKGVPREAILASGLVSPSCGLASLRPSLAERVFDLTVGVSQEMRKRYVVSQSGDAVAA